MTHHTVLGQSGPQARLPLPAELFLLAHDDRGRPQIDPAVLSLGLAGAYLIDLRVQQFVYLNADWSAATETWEPAPGRLGIPGRPDVPGDMLTHQALRMVADVLRHPTPVAAWIELFGKPALYDRVQAHLVASGILRTVTRRRFGLVPAQTHVAASPNWIIGIRVRIWSVTGGGGLPFDTALDPQVVHLCGLVGVLQLMPMVEHQMLSDGGLEARLRGLVKTYEPGLLSVLAAIDHRIGQQATAAASW